jgi:sulfite dehydrogenase (cytochrome) subunit B
MRSTLIYASVVVALPLLVGAAEVSITLSSDNAYAELKPGPGVEVTRTACPLCHSTDYIVMQPRGDVAQWQAVVTKMRQVFGAPISEPGARTIIQYLATAYGPTP